MLGVSDPAILLGLLGLSVAVTLFANWLVARFRRVTLEKGASTGFVLASLFWTALIAIGGVIATRYIQRIANTFAGYAAFALLALGLSVIRALLYDRVQAQRKAEPELDRRSLLGALSRHVMRTGAYLLWALVLYLMLSLLIGLRADPILFIPLGLGALVPDLDSQSSMLGRALPFISRRLEASLGRHQGWHSLAALALVALFTAPLICVAGARAWYALSLGFFCHLLLDILHPEGAMLFWPISRTRYSVLKEFTGFFGDAGERKLVIALAIVAMVLLLAVDLGPPPSPPVAVLTYEQTLQQYYGLRGRNLVVASIEGSWQVSGRRVAGRFEILNAIDRSFVMLDRYTGRVFTAGKAAGDQLYLSRISLETGSSIQIKSVEVHLEDQPLLDALPTLYQMQREAGLQHVFVSGDLMLQEDDLGDGLTLQPDYAQTSLRRIEIAGPGHYILRYVTASGLIEISNLKAEIADLVIIATIASPAAGPTPTPLPLPPAAATRSP